MKREIEVDHCIRVRKSMEATADKMIMRDHKHHTGSGDWLVSFNKKFGIQ